MTASLSLPDLTDENLAIEPLARAATIPSSWYVDPAYHAFDQAALFGRTWQYVGHVQQVTTPGAFLRAQVGGNPVVVVRDGEALRAFYNVCRHRGGPLVMEACGQTRMLQCKYHGWTYRLDGSLRGVPRFDRTELFDRRDYGLVPVPLAEADGLLFACLEPEAAPPLQAVLDGIAERIAPLQLAPLQFHQRVTYDVACNWKVYVDNYLEGYHLPLVHPELCNVLDYAAYVTETFPYYSLQYSPLREDSPQYGDADDEAYYYFVFPNMMLNILPGRLQVNVVEPVTHDRCRVHFDYLYADTTTPEGRARVAADLAFSDKVQQEDLEICEHAPPASWCRRRGSRTARGTGRG